MNKRERRGGRGPGTQKAPKIQKKRRARPNLQLTLLARKGGRRRREIQSWINACILLPTTSASEYYVEKDKYVHDTLA